MQKIMGNLDRIASFANWPAGASVSGLSLANSGFVYTGVSDEVICPLCGLAMKDWQQRKVNPLNEHRLRSPQCPSFSAASPSLGASGGLTSDRSPPTSAPASSMEQSTSNIADVYRSALERAKRHGVIDSDVRPTGNTATSRDLKEAGARAAVDRANPDYVLLKDESARLSTFTDWPVSGIVQPSDLAQAGLYYTGRADRACCAFCHGVLHSWQPDDDPNIEHCRHFPDCPFVRQQNVGNVPLQRRADASLHHQMAALRVSDVQQCTPSDSRSTTASNVADLSANSRTELLNQGALATGGSNQQLTMAANSTEQRTTQNTTTSNALGTATLISC